EIIQLSLVIAIHWRVRIEFGAALDAGARHDHRDFPRRPTDRSDQPLRRNQHLSTREPFAGRDDEIADDPGPIVCNKIADLAYITVSCFNSVADNLPDAAQVWITWFLLG